MSLGQKLHFLFWFLLIEIITLIHSLIWIFRVKVLSPCSFNILSVVFAIQCGDLDMTILFPLRPLENTCFSTCWTTAIQDCSFCFPWPAGCLFSQMCAPDVAFSAFKMWKKRLLDAVKKEAALFCYSSRPDIWPAWHCMPPPPVMSLELQQRLSGKTN